MGLVGKNVKIVSSTSPYANCVGVVLQVHKNLWATIRFKYDGIPRDQNFLIEDLKIID